MHKARAAARQVQAAEATASKIAENAQGIVELKEALGLVLTKLAELTDAQERLAASITAATAQMMNAARAAAKAEATAPAPEASPAPAPEPDRAKAAKK